MSLSSSDIVPTMPIQPANNGGGFGWGNDMWFIILFVLLFCGWGGGFGTNGNGAGVMDGYVLTSDFANIERKLDGVNNGICDGFYAMNTGMLNGFASVNQNISNGFMNAELSRCNQQSALMQQLFAMQMQAQNCCCENREAIQGVNYNLATQSCDTRNTIQNATRDIIDNANCNSRAILDFLVQDKMRTLESENQSLKLAASQERQNNYLVSQLRPTPIPSYPSCNPWAGGTCNACC